MWPRIGVGKPLRRLQRRQPAFARLVFDRGEHGGQAKRRAADIDQSLGAYAIAYRNAPERYWTGINAATLAFAKGDRQVADRIAAGVRAFCTAKLDSATDGEARWLISTIAEASLILGDLLDAERRYREAGAMGRDDLGDLASMRRNARIVFSRLPAGV